MARSPAPAFAEARTRASTSCPCGSARALAACCGRWHAGPQQLQAPDAAELMRSRYSAFVLGLTDYLRRTWHPSTCPDDLTLDPAVHWLGLQVRAARTLAPGRAEVEFVARSRLAGRGHRLHETSRFVFEDADGSGARWWYVDGTLHAGG